jgi:hypothetical protein
MSGVVKNVFGAFSGHQNQVLKKIFSDAWSGKKHVSMHFLTTRIKSFKNYFLMSGVVKKRFSCISKPPESSPYKRCFSTSGLVRNVF